MRRYVHHRYLRGLGYLGQDDGDLGTVAMWTPTGLFWAAGAALLLWLVVEMKFPKR